MNLINELLFNTGYYVSHELISYFCHRVVEHLNRSEHPKAKVLLKNLLTLTGRDFKSRSMEAQTPISSTVIYISYIHAFASIVEEAKVEQVDVENFKKNMEILADNISDDHTIRKDEIFESTFRLYSAIRNRKSSIERAHIKIIEDSLNKLITTIRGYNRIVKSDEYPKVISHYLAICSTNNRVIQKYDIGYFDSKGKLMGMAQQSYERLKKINILLDNLNGLIDLQTLSKVISIPSSQVVTIAWLGNSSEELFDPLGWSRKDSEIEIKFEIISKAFNVIASFAEDIHQKILDCDIETKIVYQKGPNIPNGFQTRVSGRNAIVSVPLSPGTRPLKNRAHQEGIKKKTETAVKDSQKSHKNEILTFLKARIELFSSFGKLDSYYPNKIQSYLIFEVILNYVFENYKILEDNIYLHQQMPSFFKLVNSALVASIKVLLPYAIEITQSFDIDLMKDDKLKLLFECDKYPIIKENNESKQTVENEAINFSSTEIYSQTSPQEKRHPLKCVSKDSEINFLPAPERKAAKNKRKMERSTGRSNAAVNEHMRLQRQQDEAKQKDRLKCQVKIHELPSNDLVWNSLLPGLDRDNEVTFAKKKIIM